jgi:hypothetical protein
MEDSKHVQGTAVGISFLSVAEREIQLLPVRRLSSLFVQFRSNVNGCSCYVRYIFGPNNMRKPMEFRFHQIWNVPSEVRHIGRNFVFHASADEVINMRFIV